MGLVKSLETMDLNKVGTEELERLRDFLRERANTVRGTADQLDSKADEIEQFLGGGTP